MELSSSFGTNCSLVIVHTKIKIDFLSDNHSGKFRIDRKGKSVLSDVKNILVSNFGKK